MRLFSLCLALGLALSLASSAAAVSVVDDRGATVTLVRPAQRVISMSPHATELLFAAGGGARVVGVINFSDYPEGARHLPQVGSNSALDMERVIALRPDLLVVWHSGNTERQLAQLRELGIPLFYSEPQRFEQVATSLTRLGALLGTEAPARAAALAFRKRMAALEQRYARRAPVRVFYQVWDKPLYTLNGQQIASDAIGLCGGVNVFAGLAVKAPEVSVEAVIAHNPEVILGGARYDPQDAGLSLWKPYRSLQAVARGNLFELDGDQLTRPGPRVLQGAEKLCEKLELARTRRP
jgi:iron complex transport system substrate-binding protein